MVVLFVGGFLIVLFGWVFFFLLGLFASHIHAACSKRNGRSLALRSETLPTAIRNGWQSRVKSAAGKGSQVKTRKGCETL